MQAANELPDEEDMDVDQILEHAKLVSMTQTYKPQKGKQKN